MQQAARFHTARAGRQYQLLRPLAPFPWFLVHSSSLLSEINLESLGGIFTFADDSAT
jgi:hypothetical protein